MAHDPHSGHYAVPIATNPILIVAGMIIPINAEVDGIVFIADLCQISPPRFFTVTTVCDSKHMNFWIMIFDIINDLNIFAGIDWISYITAHGNASDSIFK